MDNYYKPGTWNMICAVCGSKVKSDRIKKRWDGVFVCPDDYEERHSLDFIRGIEDDSSVPFVSSEPADEFTEHLCTLVGRSCFAGWAVAGCMIPSQPLMEDPPPLCTIEGSSAIAGYAIAGCSIAGNPVLFTEQPPHQPPRPTLMCDRLGSTSIPKFAISGCMRTGVLNNF